MSADCSFVTGVCEYIIAEKRALFEHGSFGFVGKVGMTKALIFSMPSPHFIIASFASLLRGWGVGKEAVINTFIKKLQMCKLLLDSASLEAYVCEVLRLLVRSRFGA